ncbi:MAG: hypothetical protein CMM52_00505 [Rhodospirillaceae bacterium]|nr:hypothetical protein [Rhodospirillaceae bacterium]|tara:strand:+ start:27732 stop:27917 length:186 start_codon:yes stop_codon:yes gene_type:complete
MAGDKVNVTFEINDDAEAMLEKIVDQYNLPDSSKAIRCLLDYVAEDADWDEIFKTVRCLRC